MRITGGRLRGRPLVPPTDERVRPTSDKVRQAIFNILAHNDFGVGFSLEGAHVIDLFAGTGAMGLEALSRGAEFCLFVDSAAESRALLRENVENLALTGITKIWRRDATALGPIAAGAGGPFNLAFLDPPYRNNLANPTLASLREGGWLASHALVVAECAATDQITITEHYSQLQTRRYGETAVDILVFEQRP